MINWATLAARPVFGWRNSRHPTMCSGMPVVCDTGVTERGQIPIDPKSDLPENQTPAMARFKQDPEVQKALSETLKLSAMSSEDFDAVFYPGGHGPMWDLVDNPDSIALIESFS